jgi:prephenate dehydrogenase
MYLVLKHIAQDLKSGALVMDTSPLKTPVTAWIEDLFPSGANYVGLTPVIKAEYFGEFQHGHETGHEDIFNGSLMGLVSNSKTSEKAINMAANFVQLLGASPYFSDPLEMDGLMSMTHLLPQLLTAAMLDITQKAPGWREARKFAGKHYSQMTNSFGKDELPGALAAWLDLNQENASRLINDVIRGLVELRDAVEAESVDQDKIRDGFQRLQQGRDLWLNERTDSPWIDAEKTNLPERQGIFTQMLGFRGPKPHREDS